MADMNLPGDVPRSKRAERMFRTVGMTASLVYCIRAACFTYAGQYMPWRVIEWRCQSWRANEQ